MALTRNEGNILMDDGAGVASSPEEEIIRSRGRKEAREVRVPQSPTTLATRKSPRKTSDFARVDISQYFLRSPIGKQTPVKVARGLQTPVTPTRSSPRKRLNLSGNDSGIESTPHSSMSNSRKAKRPRLCKSKSSDSEVHKLLRTLSQTQLVDLVADLVQKHPDVLDTVTTLLPKPDVAPFEERLSRLVSNVFKSLPMSKYGTGRDAFCFRRVKTHLDEFKKTFVEQGRHLVKCQDWETCIRYNVMAFKHIDELPTWDNEGHNDIKKVCFNTMTNQISMAVKKGKFDEAFLKETLDQIQKLMETKQSFGYDDKIEACIKTVEDILRHK